MTSTRTTKSTKSTEAATSAEPQLLNLSPGSLLVDANVRIDPRVDAGLITSIGEKGVLQPIVAVRTSDGRYRVKFGHRRTLAAIEAKRETVPVYVVADEATDDAGQIERVLEQWDENEHRTGLSVADKVNTVHQLAAFGVPADQIVTRLRTTSRPDVDAALIVAGSDLARAATARYDFLDFAKAAVVAEFQDDAEAVKKLIAAAATGQGQQFEHIAQKLRDARTVADREAAFAARLREAGITVIDPDAQDVTELDDLRTAEGEELYPGNHAQCPGHAAYVITTSGYVDPTTGEPIDEDAEEETPSKWGHYCEAEYVCTDPEAHGHVSRWATDTTSDPEPESTSTPQISAAERAAAIEAQKEASRRQRRELIANNKDWASAEKVRRDWVRAFLARKTKSAPKGTASFIAASFAKDAQWVSPGAGHELACQWLGCATGFGTHSALGALIGQSSEVRAQVLALAQVLAGYEVKVRRDHWQKLYRQDYVVRYLRFLQANGYTLSPVELLACGETPEPATEDPATEDPDDSGDQGD